MTPKPETTEGHISRCKHTERHLKLLYCKKKKKKLGKKEVRKKDKLGRKGQNTEIKKTEMSKIKL